MKLSRRVLLGITGLGLAASVAVPVFAATPANSTFQDPQQTLMQALIKRFNLNETDLKTFFQEQEQQRSAERLTTFTDRLATEVTAGRLTEAQKTAIIAKAKEAQAKHEEARKLTPEECKKMMDAYRTELETWLTQQGIDRSYLRDIMGGPGGPQGGRGMGPQGNMNGGQTLNGQNGMNGQIKANGQSQNGPMNGGNGQMGPGRRGGRGMFGPMNGQGFQGMGQQGMPGMNQGNLPSTGNN